MCISPADMTKLKLFKGRAKCCPSHWLRSIELTAALHNWSEAQKLCTACALLVEDAATWLDLQDFHCWQDFCTAFKKRFSNSPEENLNELMTIQQRKKEDVEMYLVRFKAKVRAYEENGDLVPNLMQIRWFVNGLHDSIKQKTMDRRPETLEDAANDAAYFHNEAQFPDGPAQSPSQQRKWPPPGENEPAWSAFQAHVHAHPHPRYFDDTFLYDLSQAAANLAYLLEHHTSSAYQAPLEKHQNEQPLPLHAAGCVDYAHHIYDKQHINPVNEALPDGTFLLPEPDPRHDWIDENSEPHLNDRRLMPPDPSIEDEMSRNAIISKHCHDDYPVGKPQDLQDCNEEYDECFLMQLASKDMPSVPMPTTKHAENE